MKECLISALTLCSNLRGLRILHTWYTLCEESLCVRGKDKRRDLVDVPASPHNIDTLTESYPHLFCLLPSGVTKQDSVKNV